MNIELTPPDEMMVNYLSTHSYPEIMVASTDGYVVDMNHTGYTQGI